jgi:cellobiose phosphorylase
LTFLLKESRPRGVRPTYNGLMVAPVIPTKWDGFSVCRIFQGVRYSILVKREGKGNIIRLMVDGLAVEGNIIPKPPSGVTQVAVQVLLS